jgi:transcriptional regulator with XRE-family HTH domain
MIMELKDFVRKRLLTLRNDFNNGEGMSQETLAKIMGITTNTISRWETGEYAIKPQNMIELSKALCVPIGAFLPVQKEKKLDQLMITAIDLSYEDLTIIIKYAEFLRIERKKEAGEECYEYLLCKRA